MAIRCVWMPPRCARTRRRCAASPDPHQMDLGTVPHLRKLSTTEKYGAYVAIGVTRLGAPRTSTSRSSQNASASLDWLFSPAARGGRSGQHARECMWWLLWIRLRGRLWLWLWLWLCLLLLRTPGLFCPSSIFLLRTTPLRPELGLWPEVARRRLACCKLARCRLARRRLAWSRLARWSALVAHCCPTNRLPHPAVVVREPGRKVGDRTAGLPSCPAFLHCGAGRGVAYSANDWAAAVFLADGLREDQRPVSTGTCENRVVSTDKEVTKEIRARSVIACDQVRCQSVALRGGLQSGHPIIAPGCPLFS